jgi:trans-aconitate 2-methyltransferase
MLELARRDHPELLWVEADAATWEPPRPADVAYSNSVFHWVLDHERLFPALVRRLAPGGVLAAQVPANWDEACHVEAFSLADEPRWRDRLAEALPPQPLLTPERYHELLTPLTDPLSVWVTTYFHVLDGPDPVVEWFKGSLLRAFLSRLEPAEGDDFVAEYRRRMAVAFPPRADGRTVLPFHRLFVVGRVPP